MRDGVLLHVLEIGGGLRREEVPQNGAKFTGGPGARVLRRFLGGLSVDLQVAVAFLVIVVDHFSGNNIDNVPARLARFADIARGLLLADVVWQSFEEGGSGFARLFDQGHVSIAGRDRRLRPRRPARGVGVVGNWGGCTLHGLTVFQFWRSRIVGIRRGVGPHKNGGRRSGSCLLRCRARDRCCRFH